MIGPEHCTPEAADRLARRLRKYWRDRGYHVEVWTVGAPYNDRMRCAHVMVRSDMIGGLPCEMYRVKPRASYRHPMVLEAAE